MTNFRNHRAHCALMRTNTTATGRSPGRGKRSGGRAMYPGVKQPVVLGLDRRVAFAGGLDETIQIGDLDMPAAVVDEIRLLQPVVHQRYPLAARADPPR